MRVFRTKEFARFCKREALHDKSLCEAVKRAETGLIDADLGGGLIKQRVPRAGQGRRGGYRTLMAFRSQGRTVFVYGFAKSERDNINGDELDFWRRVASAFLALDERKIQALLDNGEATEVFCHDET